MISHFLFTSLPNVKVQISIRKNCWNTAECSYDGGDCCNPVTLINSCQECVCRQPNKSVTIKYKTAECPKAWQPYLNNGHCEDFVRKRKCATMRINAFMFRETYANNSILSYRLVKYVSTALILFWKKKNQR